MHIAREGGAVGSEAARGEARRVRADCVRSLYSSRGGHSWIVRVVRVGKFGSLGLVGKGACSPRGVDAAAVLWRERCGGCQSGRCARGTEGGRV